MTTTVKMPEPARWHALLDDAQRPHQLKTDLHDVGFRDRRMADGWIASELDFKGWRYTLGGLFTAAQLQAYGDARMLEERERCANVCDNRAYTHTNTAMLGPEQNALKCAAAIRKGAEE